MSKTTNHTTQAGEILWLSVARPKLNEKNGKSEYSIKLKLNRNDPAVAHLSEIAEYKIDTKTNRKNNDPDYVIVNFTCGDKFQPEVVGADGQTLRGNEIPFFNGLKDKGTAAVVYSVIDYDGNKIVRLSGVKLMSLDLAPREEGGHFMGNIMEMLKAI